MFSITSIKIKFHTEWWATKFLNLFLIVFYYCRIFLSSVILHLGWIKLHMFKTFSLCQFSCKLICTDGGTPRHIQHYKFRSKLVYRQKWKCDYFEILKSGELLYLTWHGGNEFNWQYQRSTEETIEQDGKKKIKFAKCRCFPKRTRGRQPKEYLDTLESNSKVLFELQTVELQTDISIYSTRHINTFNHNNDKSNWTLYSLGNHVRRMKHCSVRRFTNL